MEQLIENMKKLQASAFSLYLKAHNYHWNVTGPNFSEYHEFFGDFYSGVWESVDAYAENIRKLGSFAPGSLSRFAGLTDIEDELMVQASNVMFARLASDNDTLIAKLYETAAMAEELNQRGLVNFLEGLIDTHEKHRWMLKSFNNL